VPLNETNEMFVPPNETVAPPHVAIIGATVRKRPAVAKKVNNQMHPASARCRDSEARGAISSADRRIRDFLLGKSSGEEVLRELYDHVLDEPVPERLRALLRR
jgi:hypothetical protein